MKTSIFALLAAILLLTAAGCGAGDKNGASDGISADSGEKTVHAAAMGEFAARVTACFADIPAYAESDMKGFVLVNEFQGWPFLINTGDPDIASKLTTGEVYVFSLAPYDLGEIPQSMVGEPAPRLEEWAMKASITGWRPAAEDEYGVVSLAPVCVEVVVDAAGN